MNEPLVSIALRAYTRIFAPGERLVVDFQIDAVEPEEVESVEATVLWYTEGKGDEDIGVHHFERFTRAGDARAALHELRSIETTLPASPLSYDGRIVKVRWCVRVRAFLTRGREAVADQWFQLGNVPAAQLPEPADRGRSPAKASSTGRKPNMQDEDAAALATF